MGNDVDVKMVNAAPDVKSSMNSPNVILASNGTQRDVRK